MVEQIRGSDVAVKFRDDWRRTGAVISLRHGDSGAKSVVRPPFRRPIIDKRTHGTSTRPKSVPSKRCADGGSTKTSAAFSAKFHAEPTKSHRAVGGSVVRRSETESARTVSSNFVSDRNSIWAYTVEMCAARLPRGTRNNGRNAFRNFYTLPETGALYIRDVRRGRNFYETISGARQKRPFSYNLYIVVVDGVGQTKPLSPTPG